MRIDFEDAIATIATNFENGNREWCQTALDEMTPTQAAYVAVGVHSVFYSNEVCEDKKLCRSWDDFLRQCGEE